MKKNALIVAVVAAAALPLLAHADDFVKPGKWQQTIHITAPNGKKEPPRTSTTCLRPQDTAHMREALAKNQGKSCKVSKYQRADDVVTWEVDCHGPTSSKTSGKMVRTSATSYKVSMDSTLSYGGHDMTSHVTGEAHRVGACP